MEKRIKMEISNSHESNVRRKNWMNMGQNSHQDYFRRQDRVRREREMSRAESKEGGTNHYEGPQKTAEKASQSLEMKRRERQREKEEREKIRVRPNLCGRGETRKAHVQLCKRTCTRQGKYIYMCENNT